MARYVVDYDYEGASSGFEFVEADTAQEAVDQIYEYVPADGIIIRGVFKEVKNWKANNNA